MKKTLVVPIAGSEVTVVRDIYIRPGRSRHLYIRFRDRRGRKQRERTGGIYRPDDGGQTARIPLRELRKAQRQLDQRRAEIADHRFAGSGERQMRFEQLMDLVRTDYARRERRSPATLESRIRSLSSFFGGMRVVDITPLGIAEYQEARRKGTLPSMRRVQQRGGRRIPWTWRPNPAAKATVNRDLEVLKVGFRLAAMQESIARVPTFPRDFSEKDNVRQGFIAHAVYRAIRAALPSDYADVLDFGYFVGWRISSILNLPWSRVNRREGFIQMEAINNKTGTPFQLWMGPELRAVLERRWRKRRPGIDLVFHVEGRRFGNWRQIWTTACAAAGAEGVLFHDLRRTTVRNLRRAGIEGKIAMLITGHETESTLDRYNITAEDDLREAAPKYSAYLRRLRPGRRPVRRKTTRPGRGRRRETSPRRQPGAYAGKEAGPGMPKDVETDVVP